MTTLAFRKLGWGLLASVSLCLLCGQLSSSSFAADNLDLQRARQLREKQKSGRALTTEEKVLLNQARSQLNKDAAGASKRSQKPGRDVADEGFNPKTKAQQLQGLYIGPWKDSGPWKPQKLGTVNSQYKTFYSKTIGQEVSYDIYFPPDYDKDKGRRFPVVYWLHGSGGNQKTGSTGDGNVLETYARALRENAAPQMIYVFVNGLVNSFYVDSQKALVESVIVKDLIPHVDQAYRTITRREGRGVEGHSMGGFGAAHLGFKYPELFGVVSIHSGAFVFPGVDTLAAAAAFEFIFGDDQVFFKANDPFELVKKNAGLIRDRTRIRILHGSKESTWAMARWEALSELLTSLGIKYDRLIVDVAGGKAGEYSSIKNHSFRKHYLILGPAKSFEFYQRAFADVK